MRTILTASIWFDDGIEHVHQPKNIKTGYCINGYRHGNCFATMKIFDSDRTYLEMEKEQGFLDSENNFLTREEAWEIAEKANQIKEDSRRFTQGRLFSEDLY